MHIQFFSVSTLLATELSLFFVCLFVFSTVLYSVLAFLKMGCKNPFIQDSCNCLLCSILGCGKNVTQLVLCDVHQKFLLLLFCGNET